MMLASEPMTFSEIQGKLNIDSGHLSYHLENLGDLIIRLPDNRYSLSISGREAIRLMKGDSTTRAYALVGSIFYLIGLTISMVTFFMIQLPTFSYLHDFFRVPYFLLGIIISGGLTAWAWITVKRIESGTSGKARTSSLVLGILGLYFGILIGGIFFLLAYTRLGK